MPDTLVVMTHESLSTVVDQKGSRLWSLAQDLETAKQCTWLLLVHNSDHELADPTSEVPHRTAFMLAKIAGFTPEMVVNGRMRWFVQISSYTPVWIPNMVKPERAFNYIDLADVQLTPVA